MNYINPQSTIWLIKGCKLDPDYANTWLPLTASLQSIHFTHTPDDETPGIANLKVVNNTVIKPSQTSVQVALPYSECIGVNYMVYQNTGSFLKYFYNFVDDIKYVSPSTTEIFFHQDLLQTWMFDYEPTYCFVEREHTETDGLGEHTLEEQNAPAGETTPVKIYNDNSLSANISVVFAFTSDDLLIPATYHLTRVPQRCGNYTDGSYLYYIPFIGNGVELQYREGQQDMHPASWWVREILDTVETSSVFDPEGGKGVLDIFICPTSFIVRGDASAAGRSFPVDNALRRQFVTDVTKIKYVARNYKLYTHPYAYLAVRNGIGDDMTLEFEKFKGVERGDEYIYFRYSFCCGMNPALTVQPEGYNNLWEAGTDSVHTITNEQMITVTGFPRLPYVSDTSMACLAMTVANTALTVAGTMVGGAPGLLIGAAKTLAFKKKDPIKTSSGSHDNTLGLYADGKMAITYLYYFQKPEYAKILDEYFDMYGYEVDTVKVPSRTNRNVFTYLKTRGCRISHLGNGVPAAVESEICKLYDKGVRWWKSYADIGDYGTEGSSSVCIRNQGTHYPS